jgi:hypothetical protein
VKRLQIMIEEELDAALARQAAEEGVSKAALIRRYVGERLRPAAPVRGRLALGDRRHGPRQAGRLGERGRRGLWSEATPVIFVDAAGFTELRV